MPMITAEQARFFARNGFLQLPACIPADVCRHLVERTWQYLPPHWRRDDPASWCGLVPDSCHTAGLVQRGGLLKFQDKALLQDPFVVAGYQAPSPGHAVAQALIGRRLRPIRVRGLYAIAPIADADVPAAPSPHVEAHPAQIVALTYLEDVAPGGGGLSVWPGSHRALYAEFESKFDYVKGPGLDAAIAALRGQPALELPGGRGDVVLIHHRLLHSPSRNRGPRIRFGFLCDYTPKDSVALAAQPPGPMWEDWPGLVQCAGGVGLDDDPDALPEAARSAAGKVPVPDDATESSRAKSEASRIARSRRPGEVWLVVADHAERFDSVLRLDPGGDELRRGSWPFRRSFAVQVDGVPIASQTRLGYAAPVPVASGGTVVLRNVQQPLWVRVVAVASPFANSRLLLQQVVDGRAREVRFTLPALATDSAGGDGQVACERMPPLGSAYP